MDVSRSTPKYIPGSRRGDFRGDRNFDIMETSPPVARATGEDKLVGIVCFGGLLGFIALSPAQADIAVSTFSLSSISDVPDQLANELSIFFFFVSSS